MPVLPFCAAIGFIAACVDWMVLCSGLLWCAVLWCWTRKIRFLRFLVFPWYRRSFRRRWMAGSELNPGRARVQLGKSPVRCWTGKSDGIGPVSFPAPLVLRLGLARHIWHGSWLRPLGVLRCWEKIQRNRTKFLIEQNFEQVRWRPRRRPGCSGRR